jgi:hypothetical protein
VAGRTSLSGREAAANAACGVGAVVGDRRCVLYVILAAFGGETSAGIRPSKDARNATVHDVDT